MTNLQTVCGKCIAGLSIGIAGVAVAQPPPVVKLFHPAGPLPSYEVATIKADTTDEHRTVRQYIGSAYGVPGALSGGLGRENVSTRVIGGPAWIDTDGYLIQGQARGEPWRTSDRMSPWDAEPAHLMMRQSLLAERLRMKAHFEVREMPVIELLPADGGIKIASIDSPPSLATLSMENGTTTVTLSATTIQRLCEILSGIAPELGGRPLVNMTGFEGKFDLKDFRFGNGSTTGVPSLSQELEDKLGIRLVPAKGQVEVLVIDSIDRPTEN